MIKFGKAIQTNMLCYARPNADEETGFKLLLVEKDLKWWMNDEDICIATVPVEYFPPDDMSEEELIMKAIESLRDKQKQILADAQYQVHKLDEKINKMLLLTHQPKDDNVINLEVPHA